MSQIYFILEQHSTCFGRSSRPPCLGLYIQHQVYAIQNFYDINLMLYLQSQTPDDGRKDRLKHVECCSKIKYI